MNQMSGMLWYDGSKKPLAEKVKTALAYYQEKYHKKPPLCLVNPKDAISIDMDTLSKECGIVVRTARQVITSHFWIGEEVIIVEVDK